MNQGLAAKLAWTELDPEASQLQDLVGRLAELDGPADDRLEWSSALWSEIAQAGVTRWSLPADFGGEACPRPLLVERYAQLAGGSLTAVFILSQHDAGVRRLLVAPPTSAASGWLAKIGEGRAFTTVGISHLTTSRRLGAQPVRAKLDSPGIYRLNGTVPWVTAAGRADVLVTGAPLDDGRQMLCAVPTDRPGVEVRPPFPLAALQASCTAEVVLCDVRVDARELLAGPANDLLASPGAVGTAGLETSALALGQARAALEALIELAPDRSDLAEPLDALCESWQTTWAQLIAQAQGRSDAAASPTQIRSQANSLVLRSTQAYLTARRGAGFLRSDPAQRWARQALFFLVWSCPTPVAQAAIRDLAGLCLA
jgi:alkylation response protein AidB-like acyl-CoA dehydrogenase